MGEKECSRSVNFAVEMGKNKIKIGNGLG